LQTLQNRDSARFLTYLAHTQYLLHHCVEKCAIESYMRFLIYFHTYLLNYLLNYLLTYLLTHSLTHSIEQSLSWEANLFLVYQVILPII
jgi:hypothetical protein